MRPPIEHWVNLSRWSSMLSLAAVAGMVALTLLAGWATWSKRAYDVRIDALVAFEARADDLSVAADALVVGALGDGAWDAFRSEADALARDLASFASAGGPGADVVAATRRLVEAVETVVAGDALLESGGAVVGPLAIPVDVARAMQDVAAVGVELDTAFDALLVANVGGGVGRTQGAAVVFAAAALAFAALTVVVLQVLHRRVGAPVVALAKLAERVTAGQRDARAVDRRKDELGTLARSMNAMLDALGTNEHALQVERAALARQSERLVASQRVAHVATWSWAPPDAPLEVSAEAFAIAGRAPTGVVPLEGVQAIVHPDDHERLHREVLDPLRRGAAVAAVVRVVRPDGELRTVRVHGEPTTAEGAATRIVGTVQDVTEEYARRRVADAQARLLATAGRVARLGGWSVDLRTGAMAWSDVVCEIHDEPLGTAPAPEDGIAYYAPEYRDRIREAFGACVRDGTPYDEEMQILTRLGRRVWVRTTATAVRDDAGALVRVEGALQDIDARKRAELRASTSERRLSQTIESLADPFVLVDRDGTIAFVNTAAAAHAGAQPAALIGRAVGAVYRGSADTNERTALEQAFRAREPYLAEVWSPAAQRWYEIRMDPVDDVFAFQGRDVTERRALLERLQRHELELRTSHDALDVALQAQRATLDALPAHVAVLDEEGTIEYVNEGWRVYGDANGLNDPGYTVGANYLDVVDRASREGAASDETANGLRRVIAGETVAFDLEYPCHGPNQRAWYRLSARRVHGDARGTGRVVVMHVDITERMLAEQSLAYVAHHDPLTTLWSRTGFAHHLGRTLLATWRPDGVVAAIDLTGFRSINDAHGYDTGDAVLAEVARRLIAAIGDEGAAARIGGDSFAVYVPANTLDGGAERVAQELVAAVFGGPITANGFALSIDVALGYTQLGVDARSVEDLLREAEVALYTGGNIDDHGIAGYTSELDAAARGRARTTSELKVALASSQLVLHYQPKVDLTTGTLLAAEALVRWRHPERGLVPPGDFIPIAEQSGLIVPIGSWVLDEACRTLARWRAEELPRVRIAVNVSVRQLVQGDFATEVADTLARHAVPPNDLTLEITESVYGSESAHLRRQLNGLHALGVRLSLDDFGTGFSSLQYLNAYHFDEIKVDRSFVRDMVRDHYSRSVVETIFGIARAIGAEAVAEGVETQRQRDALVEMGCTAAQGYYFSAPMPEDDFRWMLQNGAALPVATFPNEPNERTQAS